MLVAHAEDHITHAVIGGKKAVNFGISDDPAFFQILSSALYKNPTLAMIRETICNAWDAHIEAGITNKPIEVTIGDEYITIKDFATGIHDDLIAPIYGIYGASTKKNDGRQTGGFGLGCKSPFAYNDHFEVTSAHNGTKTIYNMSKSSGELQGKPSITPIASFPCKDSGITVKIPINPVNRDNHRLQQYVRNVVFNGDIRCNFNNELLPTLGLEQTEFGLVLLSKHDDSVSAHINHRISVRYGNVIYPVERTEQLAGLYDKVNGLLDNHYNCKLILLAPPDSISITPSRESLTGSDITNETINGLLGKFLSVFIKNQQLLFRHKELVNGYIDEAAKRVTTNPVEKLPLGNWHIPGLPNNIGKSLLTCTDDFAKLEVLLRYGKQRGLKPKKYLQYITRYMHKINEENLFDWGLMQSWLRAFQRNISALKDPAEYSYDYGYANRGLVYDVYGRSRITTAPRKRPHTDEGKVATAWWQRRVLAPLVKKLSAIPEFNRSNLYYVSKNHRHTDNYNKPAALSVKRVNLRSHTHNSLHLMTTSVVICHNAEILTKRIRDIRRTTLSTEGTMVADTYFIYEVSRKAEKLQAAKDALSQITGLDIIDLTGRTKDEQERYDDLQLKLQQNRDLVAAGKPAIIRVPKKQRVGFVRLDTIWDKDRGRINTMRFGDNKDPERVKQPVAVALISTAKDKLHTVDGLLKETSEYIVRLWGDVVATSNKRDALERITEKDPTIMPIRDFVFDQVIDKVQNKPTLIEYQKSEVKKIDDYIEGQANWDRQNSLKQLAHMLIDYPELHSLAPDIQPLDFEDKMIWSLWEDIENIRYGKRDEIRKIKDASEAVPLKPEIIKFLDELIANPFLGLIDADSARKLMRDAQQDPVQKQKLVDLLTSILT